MVAPPPFFKKELWAYKKKDWTDKSRFHSINGKLTLKRKTSKLKGYLWRMEPFKELSSSGP